MARRWWGFDNGGDWSPADPNNLYAWYRGDGPLWQNSGRSTPAGSNNDPVGAWDDKSGNGRHILQSTAASRPLLITDVVNSQDVVRGDGSDDYLYLNPGALLAQPFTYLIVAARRSDAWNPIISGYDQNVDTPRIETLFRSATSPAHRIRIDAPTPQDSAIATTSGQFHSLVIVFNGASSELYLDSTQDTLTGNPGTDGMQVIAPLIFALNDVGTLYGQVDLAEIVIQEGAVSSGARLSWDSYVSTRYGV